MTKTYLHFVWVTVFMMACGPAPTPVNPVSTKKYGEINKVLCPDGDDDNDTICNSQEKTISTLGPQCVNNAYCNGTPDSENQEAAASNPVTIILAGLAGAVLGAGTEAVFHPVENKVNEWIGSSDPVSYTLPDGSEIEFEGNQLKSVSSEFQIKATNDNQTAFYYRKKAEFRKAIRFKYGESTFEGSTTAEVCYVSRLRVSPSANMAALQLIVTKTASVDTNINSDCFQKQTPGTYIMMEKSKEYRRKNPTLLGFQPTSQNDGSYATNTQLIFSGLDTPSVANMRAAFVNNNSQGVEHSYSAVSGIDSANLDSAWQNSDTAGRLRILLQSTTPKYPVGFKFEEQL